MNTRCGKWRLVLNMDKTRIIHFRKQSMPRINHAVYFGENLLSYVDRYKYLDCVLKFHMNNGYVLFVNKKLQKMKNI